MKIAIVRKNRQSVPKDSLIETRERLFKDFLQLRRKGYRKQGNELTTLSNLTS